MIINSRKDLNAAPEKIKSQFIASLASGIHRWNWQDGEWVLIQDTSTIQRFGFTLSDFPDAPIPEKPTHNPDQDAIEAAITQAEASRKAAYQAEADPLFFKVQRGEATMEEWEAKVEEIRNRFPYPMNINEADFDTLTTLHGVDSSRANAIIDGRPWNSIHDLSSISGINQSMIDGWSITV